MGKKNLGQQRGQTKTTEFEVEGIEEAYAPAPGHKAGRPYQFEHKKIEVEVPPELEEPETPYEHVARIWILERRARGMIARIRRWLIGKKKKK